MSEQRLIGPLELRPYERITLKGGTQVYYPFHWNEQRGMYLVITENHSEYWLPPEVILKTQGAKTYHELLREKAAAAEAAR